MTRLPRLLLLLCALVGAVALTACGSDDKSDQTPQEVLRETFGASKSIKSGKLQLALDLDLRGLQGLSGPIRAEVDGPFESQGKGKLPDFDFDLDLKAGGDTFTAGAVSTGEKGYLELQGQAFDIGKELYEQFRKGYETAQTEGAKESGNDAEGPTFESLGIKPLTWLRAPQAAGEEEVGGAETTHIRAAVDVDRFLADISRLLERAEGLEIEGAGAVPGGLSAETRRQVVSAVKSARVDVWSGAEDRTLRRLRLSVDLDVPQATRKSIGGLEGGRIVFTFGMADLNEDQEVKAPANARPFEELQQALGVTLGGTGAGSTGSGSPGSTGGTGTTPGGPTGGAQAPKAYLDCLAGAGSDVSKIQGCAKFLQ